MVTLRCTQKLLRRLGVSTKAETPQPTTVLGDWYANLVYSRPHQLVLCLNERSLLAVLVSAREGKSLDARFREAVVEAEDWLSKHLYSLTAGRYPREIALELFGAPRVSRGARSARVH